MVSGEMLVGGQGWGGGEARNRYRLSHGKWRDVSRRSGVGGGGGGRERLGIGTD